MKLWLLGSLALLLWSTGTLVLMGMGTWQQGALPGVGLEGGQGRGGDETRTDEQALCRQRSAPLLGDPAPGIGCWGLDSEHSTLQRNVQMEQEMGNEVSQVAVTKRQACLGLCILRRPTVSGNRGEIFWSL